MDALIPDLSPDTIVLGVETAFLSPQVTAGFQTQFQRHRTRINVDAVGIYTVESPWGKKTYRVDTLARGGNGQNRMEISEPIDITYAPSSTVPGVVAPFLIADQAPLLRPEHKAWYIGDGVTPTTISGGDTLTFTVNTASAYPSGSASASFAGTITKIDDKGSNKGFTAVTITAIDYEGITPA